MLSYLKDPNAEIPAEQQAEGKPSKEQDFLTVATKEKEVRRSTTILGVLFIIGLIGLGVMIKKSAPKAAVSQTATDTEELKIQASIEKLYGLKSEMFGTMDEIVNKFYEFSNVVQVEVSQLVKNPFQLEALIGGDKDNGEAPSIDVEAIMRKQIEIKARELKLYSVMQSEKGVCCMVNNKILYEGGNIEDFVVKKINNDNVLLEMDGIEITLKLSK